MPTQRIIFTDDNMEAGSIPSDDAFAKYSLLSYKRDSSTDDAVTANTQVQAVFEAKGLAVGCNMRDREAMENG